MSGESSTSCPTPEEELSEWDRKTDQLIGEKFREIWNEVTRGNGPRPTAVR